MTSTATTKMSSKGQVVIPDGIRKHLRLQAGTEFIIVAKGDVLVLKTITPPPVGRFSSLVAQARAQARRAGLRRSDIREAVARARGRS